MKLFIKKGLPNESINPSIKSLELLSTDFETSSFIITDKDIPIILFTDTSESFFIDQLSSKLNRVNSESLIDITLADLVVASPAPPEGGVQSVTGSSVNNTDPLNPIINDSRPYKVFTALVNQSGTTAPVLTVLENTTGTTFSPGYVGVGRYSITPANSALLDLTKTTVTLGTYKPAQSPTTVKTSYTIFQIVPNSFEINTHQAGSSTWSQTDNILGNTLLEIRIYP